MTSFSFHQDENSKALQLSHDDDKKEIYNNRHIFFTKTNK